MVTFNLCNQWAINKFLKDSTYGKIVEPVITFSHILPKPDSADSKLN